MSSDSNSQSQHSESMVRSAEELLKNHPSENEKGEEGNVEGNNNKDNEKIIPNRNIYRRSSSPPSTSIDSDTSPEVTQSQQRTIALYLRKYVPHNVKNWKPISKDLLRFISSPRTPDPAILPQFEMPYSFMSCTDREESYRVPPKDHCDTTSSHKVALRTRPTRPLHHRPNHRARVLQEHLAQSQLPLPSASSRRTRATMHQLAKRNQQLKGQENAGLELWELDNHSKPRRLEPAAHQ